MRGSISRVFKTAELDDVRWGLTELRLLKAKLATKLSGPDSDKQPNPYIQRAPGIFGVSAMIAVGEEVLRQDSLKQPWLIEPLS